MCQCLFSLFWAIIRVWKKRIIRNKLEIMLSNSVIGPEKFVLFIGESSWNQFYDFRHLLSFGLDSNLTFFIIAQTTINMNRFLKKSSQNWSAPMQRHNNVRNQWPNCHQSTPDTYWTLGRNYLIWQIDQMSCCPRHQNSISITPFSISSNWYIVFGKASNAVNYSCGPHRKMFPTRNWYRFSSTWPILLFCWKIPSICRC